MAEKDPLVESNIAEAAQAAAVAKEAEHNALTEMVRSQIEAQTSKIYDRMDKYEFYSKQTFATKEDIDKLTALFIDPQTGKSYVAELTTVVKNFTLAAQILSAGGKWLYRTIVAIAIIIGAISLITGGFKMAGLALIHWFSPSPQ